MANVSEMGELIAQMLCYGLCADGSLLLKLIEEYKIEHGFIHGAIFVLNKVHLVNTAILDRMAESSLAVRLLEHEGEIVVKHGESYISCIPLHQPPAVSNIMPVYGEIRQYLRLHSHHTIFATPVLECVFGAIGKGCTFCTFNMAAPHPLPPKVMMDMLRQIIEDTGMDVELAIGAGTPNLKDHGVRYFAEIVKYVHEEFNIPISVELVPPLELADLDILVNAGVKSLIMSIEIWDDNIRKRVCPGKSVADKAHYLDAWRYGINLLGKGQVSSVLLVGLESEKSTCEGVDELVKLGVVPTLIPFRPYDSIKLRDYPVTDHKQYLRCSMYCISQLQSLKLSPLSQSGCTKCGGCSLEVLLCQT